MAFANFMRSTKAPPRGPDHRRTSRPASRLFNTIGCATCHVAIDHARRRRARAINGGALDVPAALGNKIIHPYSDFLLHDIGTGDGIPILPTPEFAAHRESDPHRAALGAAHAQPADARRPVVHQAGSDSTPSKPGRGAASAYNALPEEQKRQVLSFLDSL